jgi:exodeoxyribonuclease V alpha subunit
MNAPDSLEGVADHLLHVSYDQRTVLRLTTVAGDKESITAVGAVLFGVRTGEGLCPHRVTGRPPRYIRFDTFELIDRFIAYARRKDNSQMAPAKPARGSLEKRPPMARLT